MTKIVSCGYIPETAAEKQAEETAILCRNFEVIVNNFETILENEQYFYCQIGTAFLSMPYIGPDGPIPLGVLVLLWQKGDLIKQCPRCGGSAYILGAGGSPLSGTHGWWGICRTCGETKRRRGEGSFGAIWKPITEMLQQYHNESIIQKGKRPYFDWKDGLAGEATPDVIIKEKIQGVDIKTLVEELTQGE